MATLSQEIREAESEVDRASKDLIDAQNRAVDLIINSPPVNRDAAERAAKADIDSAQKGFRRALDTLKDAYRRAIEHGV
jgi:hypothetical protein